MLKMRALFVMLYLYNNLSCYTYLRTYVPVLWVLYNIMCRRLMRDVTRVSLPNERIVPVRVRPDLGGRLALESACDEEDGGEIYRPRHGILIRVTPRRLPANFLSDRQLFACLFWSVWVVQ